VSFPDDVVLCNAWREGGTREAEVLHQVRIRIPAQPRTRLMRSHLELATLDGVFIERGPFRAQRHPVSSCDAEVTTFRIDDFGQQFLTATVRHDFGEVGVIEEQYSVGEQATGVVVSDRNTGVTLVWYPPGGEGAVLEPCDTLDPAAEPYLALEAMIGEATTGERRVVYRSFLTHDTFAGSYPVRFQSAGVIDPTTPFSSWTTTAGAFSHVYVAQHHNWVDESLIHFDRDTVNWHTRFRPGLDVEMTTVRRVELDGVDEFERGDGFVVIETALPAGTDTARRYALTQPVRGLSSTQILRDVQFDGPRCADNADLTVRGVGPLGVAGVALQLLTCPRSAAPGFAVVGVVPVLVPDIDAIGTVIDDVTAVTVDGAPGFSFPLGGETARLSFPEATYALFQIGSGDSHFLEVGSIDRVRTADIEGLDLAQRFESGDDRVQLQLSLQRAGQGAGHTTIWAPRFAVLTLDGERFVAGALDAMVYENTHHNWYDRFEAVSGDVTFAWRTSTELEGECGVGEFLCWFVTVERGGEVLLDDAPVTLVQE
jgi:hypothetical protein